MAKKDILSQISQEITKYRIEIKGLSILPFALYFTITYLPTQETVGYVKWNIFQGVEGEIMIKLDGKKYYFRYKNGEWTISEG